MRGSLLVAVLTSLVTAGAARASILSPPSGTLPSGVSDPGGLVMDLSVGGESPFGPDAKVSVEIGYQIGFQGTSLNGQDVGARSRFLHVGFGFALGL